MTADAGTADEGRAFGVLMTAGRLEARYTQTTLEPLSNHLGLLLQARNLVVLVGAGASYHVGSPRIRGLTTADIDQLLTAADVVLEGEMAEIVHALLEAADGDIERTLAALQTAISFTRRTGQAKVEIGGCSATAPQLVQVRAALNRSLSFACDLPKLPATGVVATDPLAAHRQFFARLATARRANLPRPRVFTTNYDLMIEKTLDDLGLAYIDGFTGTVDRRLNLATYGLDFYRIEPTTQAPISRLDAALYLHKVHGSINWRRSRNVDGALSLAGVQQTSSADDGELCLVYPTPAKEEDALAYPYADLLRVLSAVLSLPETVVIAVGYGFWDEHINRLVFDALATNMQLNLLAVDPFGPIGDFDTCLSTPLGEPVVEAAFRNDHPLGELARIEDARISVLTGEVAKFEVFSEVIPTAARLQWADPANLSLALQRIVEGRDGDAT